jgi:hypothetical protein
LRDIFVTEYGAADVRGLSDRDTIAAMLAIADSRFQPSLLAEAVRSRKIEDGFRIGDAFRNNTPARIENALGPARDRGLLPQFPFGTDFTTEEIALLPALARLKAAQSSPFRLAALAARGAALKGADSTEKTLLARMRLESPASIKEHFYASLVLGALRSAGA